MTWKPIILKCPDPENCEELHNELPLWMEQEGIAHHYGCECNECMRFYWYLKH